jgi:hypothetical protein
MAVAIDGTAGAPCVLAVNSERKPQWRPAAFARAEELAGVRVGAFDVAACDGVDLNSERKTMAERYRSRDWR